MQKRHTFYSPNKDRVVTVQMPKGINISQIENTEKEHSE